MTGPLLWAVLIGVVGALATVAFHKGVAFTERDATGHPGGLGGGGGAGPATLAPRHHSGARWPRGRRVPVMGAAAGFASAYDAALSGAIFIAEVVYGTLVKRCAQLMKISSRKAN